MYITNTRDTPQQQILAPYSNTYSISQILTPYTSTGGGMLYIAGEGLFQVQKKKNLKNQLAAQFMTT